MLAVEGVCFSYGAGRPVLDGVGFEVGRGDIACLLGPNGTGKTTLLRCVMGLSRPSAGRICLDGRDLAGVRPRERSRLLAYVPQSTSLAFPYDVLEVVLMGRVSRLSLGASHSAEDLDVARESLARLGAEELAGRTYQELSGGERQMVMVARALAQQADYLVMDEPTASLDYANQVRVLEAVSQLAADGLGILMTSHFPDHAFLACTKAVLMRDGGVLAQGPPGEVVTSESLTALYGTAVCVTDAKIFGERTRVCVPVMGRGLQGAAFPGHGARKATPSLSCGTPSGRSSNPACEPARFGAGASADGTARAGPGALGTLGEGPESRIP